jgi:predicted MPP superfamily phosphohydrolase
VHRPTRREVLQTGFAVATGLATGAAAHGYFWERHDVRLTSVDLPVRDLPPAFEALRVGFITDLHLSAQVPAQAVADAVELLNSAAPDLTLLGGDYVSFTERAYMGPVAELLGELRASHGVFGIIGNHDDERYMPAELRSRRIGMLLDDHMILESRGDRLGIVGLKFWTNKARQVREVVGRSGHPHLLLAHDPRRIAEAAQLAVPAVLAGHTHGGQVVLPGLGAVAARRFPVASGRASRERSEMFVSRGVGTVVIPIRFNCPPEVAVVTLRGTVRDRPR